MLVLIVYILITIIELKQDKQTNFKVITKDFKQKKLP